MPIVLILALLLSGSVSVAANNTVPGDILYPIKVNVNEQLHSAVSFSNESKAAFEAERANRRLVEAEQLAAQGKLTAEVAADLNARFVEESDASRAYLADVEKENPEAAAKISANLEAALGTHEQALAALSGHEAAQIQASVTQERTDSASALASAEMKAKAAATTTTKTQVEGHVDESSTKNASNTNSVGVNAAAKLQLNLGE